MRILLVDDDESRVTSLAMYICEALTLDAGAIHHAPCLDDARRLLRANYYDAVVLDVVIPKRIADGHPSATHAISLLDELARSARLNRPGRIIGLTAHLDDVTNFKKAFEDHCYVVVEAPSGSDEWRAKICRGLDASRSSRLSHDVNQDGLAVMTIHGIRTYGAWQGHVQRTIAEAVGGVTFLNYKYGYFSAPSLLIPPLRKREVRKLVSHLQTQFNEFRGSRLVIFAHSFGTYLVAEALKLILPTMRPEFRVTLVLAGSVLDANYDWRFLAGKRVSIVNECGDRDHVLWLSHAFALGLGMAGKTGFNGFDRSEFCNRHFSGGHSLYFDDPGFTTKYWLPLIENEVGAVTIDRRSVPSGIYMMAEGIIRALGRLKPLTYWILFAALVAILLHTYI